MRRTGQMLIAGAVLLLLAATASAQPQPPPAGPHGWPNRGRLGMEVQSMTDALREFFAVPADRGVLVVRVLPERAAAQAGIAVGDVITMAEGTPIEEPLELIAAVARVPAGQSLALEVVRRGKTETIAVAPEGDAIEFTPPPPGKSGHERRAELRAHLIESLREILRRLETIEQRLDRMEQNKGTSPGEERT